MRIKPKKRLKREKSEQLTISASRNISWSMDFMLDQLSDVCSVRLLNMIDDFNRETMAIDVDFSLSAIRVVRMLEQIIEWKGKLSSIGCDSDPEYLGNDLI